MTDSFKVGYYYKFIGNENKYFWTDDTKLIFNNRWHKCIKIDDRFRVYVKFEGEKYGHLWFYEDFIESKYSPREKVKKLLEEI